MEVNVHDNNSIDQNLHIEYLEYTHATCGSELKKSSVSSLSNIRRAGLLLLCSECNEQAFVEHGSHIELELFRMAIQQEACAITIGDNQNGINNNPSTASTI
jgi:hypothetical protein